MPLSHVSKLFAVQDCKVSKLTADPAGGSPTYATSIDVPGIKTMEIGGDVNTNELRGDNQQLDFGAVLGGVTVDVEHAKIHLDVLAILLGGTVTDSGTTPNQVATYSLPGGAAFSYFKLEGKTPTGGADTPTGDVHFILWRCILASFPSIGFAEEDYRTVSFSAQAVPLVSSGKLLDAVANETAAVIA